jgi:hypothetical protein
LASAWLNFWQYRVKFPSLMNCRRAARLRRDVFGQRPVAASIPCSTRKALTARAAGFPKDIHDAACAQ